MDQSGGISCRPSNILNINGILKAIEWLCDLLAVILCGAASTVDGGSGHKGFFLFVSILALIVTFAILIILVLNVQNTVLVERWPIIEIGWCAFIALFYFIASIVIATIAKQNGTYGGAAFFGFAAMIAYIADAVFQFRNRNALNSNNTQFAPNTYNSRSEPYATNGGNDRH